MKTKRNHSLPPLPTTFKSLTIKVGLGSADWGCCARLQNSPLPSTFNLLTLNTESIIARGSQCLCPRYQNPSRSPPCSPHLNLSPHSGTDWNTQIGAFLKFSIKIWPSLRGGLSWSNSK